MTRLTEHTVLARTRAQDLRSVRKLNAWGSELTDVSIVRSLPNVEVLSLSVNSIASLQDFAYCDSLQELYLRRNNISDLSELKYLQDLTKLRNLWLADNPCAEVENYRLTVIRALPQLQKLDNMTICPEEQESAKLHGNLIEKAENQDKISQVAVVSHSVETVVQYQNSFSSDSQSTFALENAPVSKTSTPQPSPLDPFPPKLEDSLNMSRSYIEEISVNQVKENEITEVVALQHQSGTSDSQTNCLTGKQCVSSTIESRPSFEPELSLDRHPDLILNDRFSPGCTFSPYSGRPHPRSDRAAAIRMLPKGGKNRNANILSAVLCLIKELDWPSLEVVDTAVHCLMEELEAEQNSNTQSGGVY